MSTAVLAVVLIVMLLMLCGLVVFYTAVVNPPTKRETVDDVKTGVTARITDSYYGFGEATGERFKRPHDVAVGPGGDIYVADMGNRRLVRLTRSGALVSQLPGGKWGAGKLDAPVGIDVAPDGRVYVADRGFEGPHGKLIILAPDMKTIKKEVFFTPEDFPITPRVEGEELYVTSASGVHVFDLEGNSLRSWGGELGKKPGQFAYPNGIVKLNDGRIVVTDSNNRRIDFYDQRGKLLSMVGTPPADMADTALGAFSLPMGVATDDDGIIYVVDAFAFAIRLLDKDGRQIAKVGDFGSGQSQFYNPGGIVRETGHTFLIADELNHRIVRVTFDVPAGLLAGKGGKPAFQAGRPSTWFGPWCLWCLPLLVILLLVAYVLWRLRKRAREDSGPSAEARGTDAGQGTEDNLT